MVLSVMVTEKNSFKMSLRTADLLRTGTQKWGIRLLQAFLFWKPWTIASPPQIPSFSSGTLFNGRGTFWMGVVIPVSSFLSNIPGRRDNLLDSTLEKTTTGNSYLLWGCSEQQLVASPSTHSRIWDKLEATKLPIHCRIWSFSGIVSQYFWLPKKHVSEKSIYKWKYCMICVANDVLTFLEAPLIFLTNNCSIYYR